MHTLITVNCKRCGKQLIASKYSYFGLDSLKQQTGYICESCTTPEEKYELNIKIGEGIIKR